MTFPHCVNCEGGTMTFKIIAVTHRMSGFSFLQFVFGTPCIQIHTHPLFLSLQVLLSCGGSDGSYLVAAEARRKLNMNNTIFCLRIPSIGVLLHPKHPDTTFYTQSKVY